MSTILALNCSSVSCCSLVFCTQCIHLPTGIALIRQISLGWGLISQPNFWTRRHIALALTRAYCLPSCHASHFSAGSRCNHEQPMD